MKNVFFNHPYTFKKKEQPYCFSPINIYDHECFSYSLEYFIEIYYKKENKCGDIAFLNFPSKNSDQIFSKDHIFCQYF